MLVSTDSVVMLNVEEFVCPEMTLAMCHVKEAVRTVLHTLVVCRSLGGLWPAEPRPTFSEVLDLTYMRTDCAEFEQELEPKVRQFSELFERDLAHSGRAQLIFSFYTTKSRKQSIWNIIVGSDEKIVFEQWRLPVIVMPMRRYPNPADNLKEEANAQATAAQQVQQTLQFILFRVNAKVDHLPPPPPSQPSYKFEVSFASLDGRSLGGGGSAAAARLGTSLSSTIKHIPYIT